MPNDRRIFFSRSCDAAAERLGGYERIDASLDAAWDGLVHDPTGFSEIKCELWFSARYIPTKPFGRVPALVWVFVIEADGDVVIDHVEEFEGY